MLDIKGLLMLDAAIELKATARGSKFMYTLVSFLSSFFAVALIDSLSHA